MAFRDFAKGAFLLPGTIVSRLFDFVFGPTSRNNVINHKGQEVKGYGLLGGLLNLAKLLGLAIADVIAAHKKSIAIAFWSSLALGAVAALTVAFWPAALTTATTFTINGYSIAGLVGAGFTAQVGAVAAVAALAASTAVYTVAAVANTINGIIGLFPKKTVDEPQDPHSNIGSSSYASLSELMIPGQDPNLGIKDASSVAAQNSTAYAWAPQPNSRPPATPDSPVSRRSNESF